MANSWDNHLNSAEQALKEGKFFDGTQSINTCMTTFAKQVSADDGDSILKNPTEFIGRVSDTLTSEQKGALRRMYEIRGDMITGLGANKRAAVDYAAAQMLSSAADTGLAEKKARVEKLSQNPADVSDKVPVTVITGFLGAGKTTLLNRILKENHGKRIAVIENEFGEVGIDDGLIETQTGSVTTEENIVEMNNGCICCTVRGDLIAGLKKLVKNATKNSKPLDGVLIETTGLADPAPVAQTFFADDYIQQKFQLDGILTVVDAGHLIIHLDEEKPEGVENEAVEQVAFADRILLNKCDTVEEASLEEVERRIRMINDAVKIKRCVKSEVDMDYLLGLRAFSLDKILEMDDAFLDDNQDHQHDNRVSSVGFHIKGEVDEKKLNDWIGWVMREKGNDIFRTKGIIAVRGMKEKFVIQAVHMAFSGAPQRQWEDDEERICKLTFIGKNLNREELEKGFKDCLAK